MAGLLRRMFSRETPAAQVLRTTTRTEWDALGKETSTRVVQGCRFCIGVVAREEGAGAAFLEALEKLDTKRLFHHDLDRLDEIVNGLDEIKDQLPINLKPKSGAVTQYLLQKRFKGRGGPPSPA